MAIHLFPLLRTRHFWRNLLYSILLIPPLPIFGALIIVNTLTFSYLSIPSSNQTKKILKPTTFLTTPDTTFLSRLACPSCTFSSSFPKFTFIAAPLISPLFLPLIHLSLPIGGRGIMDLYSPSIMLCRKNSALTSKNFSPPPPSKNGKGVPKFYFSLWPRLWRTNPLLPKLYQSWYSSIRAQPKSHKPFLSKNANMTAMETKPENAENALFFPKSLINPPSVSLRWSTLLNISPFLLDPNMVGGG